MGLLKNTAKYILKVVMGIKSSWRSSRVKTRLMNTSLWKVIFRKASTKYGLMIMCIVGPARSNRWNYRTNSSCWISSRKGIDWDI